MGYLGGKQIEDIVREGYRTPAPPAGSVPSLRDVVLASGRAHDQRALDLFEAAVESVLDAADQHQILHAIMVIAAGQMHGLDDPYRTVVLPGRTLAEAGRKIAATTMPAANGFTDNQAPRAVYVGDQRTVPNATHAKLTLAGTLIHEYAHVALAAVYQNNSVPWRNGDERKKSASAPAFRRVEELMDNFVKTPGTLAKPAVVRDVDPWLHDTFAILLRDWKDQSTGTTGKINLESVPYLAEGIFYSVRYDAWAYFIEQTPIAMGAYQKHIWPDLVTAEEAVRRRGAITVPPYPGVDRRVFVAA